jgi:predicted RNA polymerase sigma factor
MVLRTQYDFEFVRIRHETPRPFATDGDHLSVDLLSLRDDPIVRVNRAVAIAEVMSPQAALDEVETLDAAALESFAPYHAVRADLLARPGSRDEARKSYDKVLSLLPPPAERLWLERKRSVLGLGTGGVS